MLGGKCDSVVQSLLQQCKWCTTKHQCANDDASSYDVRGTCDTTPASSLSRLFFCVESFPCILPFVSPRPPFRLSYNHGAHSGSCRANLPGDVALLIKSKTT